MAVLLKPGVYITHTDYSDIPEYVIRSDAIVDNVKWYTLSVNDHVFAWLVTQDPKCWYYHKTNLTVDVSEELMIIMKIKFYGQILHQLD